MHKIVGSSCTPALGIPSYTHCLNTEQITLNYCALPEPTNILKEEEKNGEIRPTLTNSQKVGWMGLLFAFYLLPVH